MPRLPDIDRALPSQTYIQPHVFEVERRELFHKSWIFVCHEGALAQPGAFVTTELYGQDILIIRSQDGELRAFYNVCPHRGHRLLEGRGRKRLLVCPYHAWTFDTNGDLQRARAGDSALGFEPASNGICLSPVRVETLLSFVFVNLNPQAASLADHANGLAEHILAVRPDLDDYRPTQGSDYFGGAYAANWKVVLDNFLECYHCSVAHPSFGDMMNVAGNRFSFHGNYSYQFLPTAGKADNRAFALDLEQDDLDGHFWYLFPNTIFSIFPGTKSFSVSRADPISVEATQRHFTILEPEGVDPGRRQARSTWGLEVVNEEDRALCEQVQRGMRQYGFERGYYMVTPDSGEHTEEAVKFFHDLYRAHMQDKLALDLS